MAGNKYDTPFAIHKKLYKMLDNDEIYTFGYMSQNEWIKSNYTKKL